MKNSIRTQSTPHRPMHTKTELDRFCFGDIYIMCACERERKEIEIEVASRERERSFRFHFVSFRERSF